MDGFRIAAAYVEVDADTAKADAKVDALISKLETVAGHTYEAKVDLTGDALTEVAKIEAALAALRGSGGDIRIGASTAAMQRDLADASADLMMQTALLREVRDLLLQDAAAATVYNIAIRSARDATAGTGLAANAAAASFRIWGTGLRVGAVGLHGLISGAVELAAVLIPATVAAGAWAAVWMQGAQNVAQHMNAVYTATEATSNMFHVTAGQAVGLGGALQKAQDAANPQVYQALGAGVKLVNEHFGNLAQTGLKVGGIFDTFTAKLVQDFAPGGSLGGAMNSVLSKMVTDLTQIGQVFGNLGHAVLEFGSKMPGAANLLLSFVDVVTKLIAAASNLPRPLIYAAFALHEINTWGSVAVKGLDYLGLSTATVTGRFFSLTRAAGVLKNVFGIIPLLITRFGDAVAVTGGILPVFSARVTAAGEAIAAFGTDTSVGLASLGTGGVLAIAAIAASVGYLTYRVATAKSAYGEFAAAQQAAVSKASNTGAINAIVSSMSELSDKTNIAAAAAQHMGSVTLQAEKGSHAWNQTVAANRQEMAQLGQEFVTVGTHAAFLADKYQTSLPGAMALADAAGVNLTQTMTKQAWAIAQIKIKDLVQGYESMGQPAGVVGNDMTALAIAAGLQASKVQQLNQAWDSFMSTVTGGTSGLASFEQSLTNLTSGANTVTTILGRSGSLTLGVNDFAASLKSFSGAGAQAWQNFDNVVGSTAPQLIDWFRTAGAEGALSGQNFTQAVKDMIAQLLPFARDSRTATSTLSDLAQQAHGPATSSFKTLKDWVGNTSGAAKDLQKQIETTTQKMGDMAGVAEKLGTVVHQDLVNMMASATLSASGAQKAMDAYAKSIENGNAQSSAGQSQRAALIRDLEKAGLTAKQAAAYVKLLADNIAGLHGKNIHINTIIDTVQGSGAAISGQTIRGITGGSRGMVVPGYAPGVDDRIIAVGPGEGILVPEAVRGIGGPDAVHALNRMYGGSRVGRGNKTGGFAAGGITTSATATYGFAKDIFNIDVGVTNPPAGGGNMKALFDYWMAHYAAYRQAHQNIYGGLTGQALFRYWQTHWQTWIRDNLFRVGGTGTGTGAAGPAALPAIGAGIIKALDGTASQIAGAIASITAEVKKGFSAGVIGAGQESGLVTLLKHDNATLQMLANDRKKIEDQIARADSYAKSVTQNAEQWASLTEAQTLSGAKKISAHSISVGLRDALHMITAFAGAIRKLAKEGLNRTLLDQIIQMGPGPDGLAYARALEAATPKQLLMINAAEAGITRQSTLLGQTAADAFYGLGEGTGKGFLKGLKDSLKQVDSVMAQIIRELVAKLKRELKIKSPSEVMAEIGVQIPAGLAAGIRAGMREVDDAAGLMAGRFGPHGGPPPRAIGTYGQGHGGCRPVNVNFYGTKWPTPEQLHAMNMGLTMAVANA